MNYAVEMGSGGMIYIPSFMTIVSGYCPYNLRGCNVGITDVRDYELRR
jgi:hypothetical protein